MNEPAFVVVVLEGERVLALVGLFELDSVEFGQGNLVQLLGVARLNADERDVEAILESALSAVRGKTARDSDEIAEYVDKYHKRKGQN